MIKQTEMDTRKILEALASYGENGCGIISLSLDTGLNQQTLRRFLRKHKEYCVPLIGESKHRLNQLTEENDSVEKIIDSIEQQQAKEKVNARVSNAFIWGMTLGLILPYLIQLSLDF